jgi:spectrin beta
LIEHFYSTHIRFVLCVFRDAWNQLLEQIDNRDQKLLGAEEIHRFNRDVEDALTRIQEKASSIPDDLGRDFNATSSYLKRHEAFENELVALEAQVRCFVFCNACELLMEQGSLRRGGADCHPLYPLFLVYFD